MIHWKGTALTFVILLIHQVFSAEDSLLPFQVNTPANFNYSNLMTQYIATCGLAVCDKSFGPFRNVEGYVYCPCSCDLECLTDPKRGPCCPDLYFKYNLRSCRSLKITNSVVGPNHYFEMVDYCPENTSKELQNKCSVHRKPSERMLIPPVSNRGIPLLFWNKYCAECHNVSDVDPLSLNFTCNVPTDFNYLSTYEQIIEKAEDSRCNISFEESNNLTTCNSEVSQLISSCNVTGTWMTYDISIETACNSAFESVFMSVFKNVFCYMCNAPNPLALSNSLIDTCPNYDLPLKNLCNQYPKVQATFPYKNIFCKLCNELDDSFYTKIVLNKTADNLQILYSITLIESLFRYKRQLPPRARPRTPMDSELFTKLVLKNVAFTGRGVCFPSSLTKDYPEEMVSTCSCNNKCYEDCCIDYALKSPIHACISAKFPPEIEPQGKFRVIDSCTSESLLSCRSPDSENFVNLVPMTDSRSGVTYINSYCYFCNTRVGFPPKEFIPWGIKATCSQFFNPHFYPDVYDFLNVLKKVNCSFNLVPYDAAQTCDKGKATINTCNSTGLWTTKDEDIEVACEHLNLNHLPEIGPTKNTKHVFKNIFCQMCNPVLEEPGEIIGSCGNETESNLAKACENFPFLQMSSSYRNAFCEKCHDHKSENQELKKTVRDFRQFSDVQINVRLDKKFAKAAKPTYRALFSLSSYKEEDATPEYIEKVCQKNEFLDRRQVRKHVR